MTVFLEADIAGKVIELCRWIGQESAIHIDLRMSLTRDLSFDSMKLMQFFSGVEDLYPGIALEDWFIDNASGGRDTLESVVGYLGKILSQVPRAAAE